MSLWPLHCCSRGSAGPEGCRTCSSTHSTGFLPPIFAQLEHQPREHLLTLCLCPYHRCLLHPSWEGRSPKHVEQIALCSLPPPSEGCRGWGEERLC